jgi:hypothetical protein
VPRFVLARLHAAARFKNAIHRLAAQVVIQAPGGGRSGTRFPVPFAGAQRDGSAPVKTLHLRLEQSSVSPDPADLRSIGISTASATDAGGVSAPQHPHNIWTERRDARGSALKIRFRALTCDVYYVTKLLKGFAEATGAQWAARVPSAGSYLNIFPSHDHANCTDLRCPRSRHPTCHRGLLRGRRGRGLRLSPRRGS